MRLAVVEQSEQQAGGEDEQDAGQHADAGAVDAPRPPREQHVADGIGVHFVFAGAGRQLQHGAAEEGWQGIPVTPIPNNSSFNQTMF